MFESNNQSIQDEINTEEWAASLRIFKKGITYLCFWLFVFLFIFTRGWETPLAMQFQRSGQLVCKFKGTYRIFFCFVFLIVFSF
jgi:hypothetical protein